MTLLRISISLAWVMLNFSPATIAEITLIPPTEHTQTTDTPPDFEDTLTLVMQRMQSESAVKIAYQETRHLELMQEPWQASGYLYALAPDTLIKEQQLPARVIMAASGDKLSYYDPVNKVRHQATMRSDDPLSLNVAAFKGLVTGDLQLLKKMYVIAFSSNTERWLLTLTSHEQNDTAIKVIITGVTGQQASTITVHQADGDRSEFTLTESARGEQLIAKIEHLQQELIGE